MISKHMNIFKRNLKTSLKQENFRLRFYYCWLVIHFEVFSENFLTFDGESIQRIKREGKDLHWSMLED